MNVTIADSHLQELRSIGLIGPEFFTDIDDRDEIYAFLTKHPACKDRPVAAYFESGRNAFLSLVRVMHDLGRSVSTTNRMLEFACGYGRVTRHIVRTLPSSRLAVSDIVAEAVDFQRATFNVSGFVSHEDPGQCQIPEKYDVIFVASLFSHLPLTLWHQWLRKLHGALAPDGLLVFSVHGPNCVPSGHAIGEDGFLYFKSSESALLDVNIYGTTYVTREFVERSIVDISGRKSLAVYERGICNYQDVYVVGNSSREENRMLATGR